MRNRPVRRRCWLDESKLLTSKSRTTHSPMMGTQKDFNESVKNRTRTVTADAGELKVGGTPSNDGWEHESSTSGGDAVVTERNAISLSGKLLRTACIFAAMFTSVMTLKIEYNYDNMEYDYNNIGYDYNNIEYGYNNIEYDYNNIGFDYNNIEYDYNNIEYSYNNIEDNNNIECCITTV